ncbi:MAG TPA: N-acetylglucosamine-6-phosphate deacetylase [Agriterribacter sp.]|nr:N-acetylglucosamine-6-phosphate deacetylase [Agriterribacter sp.]
MKIAYWNGTIYTGNKKETGKAILVNNHTIEQLVGEKDIPGDYNIKNLGGLNIAPSFIDLQIYGGNGQLFSAELTTDAIAATYQYCLRGGCSHFMITMATNTIDIFLKGMELVKQYWQEGGKGLLGLHLEGPYLNPKKKGAHIEACIKKPTVAEVSMLLEKGKGVLKMMTIAPEVCDEGIIRMLVENDIIVSAGHSNATYSEATSAFALGIPTATHLFNAMSPFQSREPGLVGAIYDNDAVKSSIVSDGVHVDFASVRISKKLMGNRLFFITDAVAETTKGDYPHVFTGDRYTLPDGTLSGSALTMMQSVKNGVAHAGIPLEEALRMAAMYPAQLLRAGAPLLGKIEAGYAADFVVFNNSLEVKEVITV